MKAKQTSDNPTALARHYKGVVAEQSAEIERLTAALATAEAERDAAVNALAMVAYEGYGISAGENVAVTAYDRGAGGFYVVYEDELPCLVKTFDEAWSILFKKSDVIRVRGIDRQGDKQLAPQPTAAPAVDAAPVGELTDAESARLTTPFLHTMMVCGEVRDVFAGEFAAGIQQNVELENERALLSWRDRDLDSAMLHLINASARNAELIRRLQERKTR